MAYTSTTDVPKVFPPCRDGRISLMSDEFYMFDFKVNPCKLEKFHDWKECPFSHPMEPARRRDPRRFHYSRIRCLDFHTRGGCAKGDACQFAHGMFERELHPARFRTRICRYGERCYKRVCFHAHTTQQLRVLSPDNQVASVDARTDRSNGNKVAADSAPRLPNDFHLGSTAPANHHTRMCRYGKTCHKRVCGFAHSREELRVLSRGAHAGRAGARTNRSNNKAAAVSAARLPPVFHSGSPTRVNYRTRLCRNGRGCRKQQCAFAHSSEELAPLPAAVQAGLSNNQFASANRSLLHSYAGYLGQDTARPSRSGHDAPSSSETTSANYALLQPWAFKPGECDVPSVHGVYMEGPFSVLSQWSNSSATMAPHEHNMYTAHQRMHQGSVSSMPAPSIFRTDHTHQVNGTVQNVFWVPSVCFIPSLDGTNTGSPSISTLGVDIHQVGLTSINLTPLWPQAQIPTMMPASQFYDGPSPQACSQNVLSTTNLHYENQSGQWDMEEHKEVESSIPCVQSGGGLQNWIYRGNRGEAGVDYADVLDLEEIGVETQVDETHHLDWVNDLLKEELV